MTLRIYAAALLVATFCSAHALAADGPIIVAHPWLRATPKSAPVAGGYATITNTGKAPDTLVSASLPMAPDGQIHTMTMKNGVMEMRRLADGLVIAPGTTVTLRPGGDHLMFLEPKLQLKAGERVVGSLTFKAAGTVPVTFAVGGMAAKVAPDMETSGHDAHQGMDMTGMKGMDMH